MFLTAGWLPYSSPLYSTRVGHDDWRAGLWSDLCGYDGRKQAESFEPICFYWLFVPLQLFVSTFSRIDEPFGKKMKIAVISSGETNDNTLPAIVFL